MVCTGIYGMYIYMVFMLYINLNYTNLSYKIYTIILKNHMQKTLDAILVKTNQLLPKLEQYYTHFPRLEM